MDVIVKLKRYVVALKNAAKALDLPYNAPALDFPRSTHLLRLNLQMVHAVLHFSELVRLRTKLPLILCTNLREVSAVYNAVRCFWILSVYMNSSRWTNLRQGTAHRT